MQCHCVPSNAGNKCVRKCGSVTLQCFSSVLLGLELPDVNCLLNVSVFRCTSLSLCHAELILEWSIFARSVLDSDDLFLLEIPQDVLLQTKISRDTVKSMHSNALT